MYIIPLHLIYFMLYAVPSCTLLYDQFGKPADLIPEAYAFILIFQCLVGLTHGLLSLTNLREPMAPHLGQRYIPPVYNNSM